MSMDNDTRLAMMNMRNNAQQPVRPRTGRARRRFAVPGAAGLFAMALTLFARGA